MTPNDYKWHHCEKKKRYRNKKNAQSAIKNLRKRKVINTSICCYPCHFCNGWHIGHNTLKDKNLQLPDKSTKWNALLSFIDIAVKTDQVKLNESDTVFLKDMRSILSVGRLLTKNQDSRVQNIFNRLILTKIKEENTNHLEKVID